MKKYLKVTLISIAIMIMTTITVFGAVTFVNHVPSEQDCITKLETYYYINTRDNDVDGVLEDTDMRYYITSNTQFYVKKTGDLCEAFDMNNNPLTIDYGTFKYADGSLLWVVQGSDQGTAISITGNNFNHYFSNVLVKDETGANIYIPPIDDSESSLICLQTFTPFRWPIMGMPIQFEFTVPYSSTYEYNSETITVTGTDSDATTIGTYQLESYPQLILNQEAGKIVGNFTITPFYNVKNVTADKKIKITLTTPTHTFTQVEFTIPTIIGFTDTNNDGLDDRDGKSQEQITVPQIEQETNDYILEKPLRSEYADGILGSVEYGFATLLYYVEYPFVALGNLLQKLITIFSQAFTWMGTFTQFLQQIFSFLPQEVTACIIVAFIAGTIALIYRMFRGA